MDQPPPYPNQPYPGSQLPQDNKTGPPPQGQAPGYPPTQYGMGTTTVVMQQPTVVQTLVPNSPYPMNMNCPHCHANIMTSVAYSDGLMVWLIAGGLCLVGLWLGCCLIPFCINDLKDVTHSCPNCSAVVGHYKRI